MRSTVKKEIVCHTVTDAMALMTVETTAMKKAAVSCLVFIQTCCTVAARWQRVDINCCFLPS